MSLGRPLIPLQLEQEQHEQLEAMAGGLQPHRARHFQLSNDPFFVEKYGTLSGFI